MQPEPDAVTPEVMAPRPRRTERDKQIGYTSFGLLLLLVAVLLQWIPVIEYLGLLVGALGAIEMIRGAPPFGGRHRALVMVSVILFALSEIAAFVLAEDFASAASSVPPTGGPVAAAAFLGMYDGLIEGLLVVVTLTSVCFLLIAFDLEDAPGKLLLVGGVATQVAISVALFVLVFNPLVHQAVSQAFASNPMDVSVIQAAIDQVHAMSGLNLLNGIPAVFFAVGYEWASRRIGRQAIPRPPPGSGQPPVVPKADRE